MSLYDEYEPNPPVPCLACGRTLTEWRGKDGPSRLLRWRQGEPRPAIPRGVGEAEIASFADERLPLLFEIAAECRCGRWHHLTCTTVNGAWVTATPGRTGVAAPEPRFPDEIGRRRCGACGNVWVCDPATLLARCPACDRPTRLVTKE